MRDDDEEPALFLPSGKDESSSSFIHSGIPSGSGASMSRFHLPAPAGALTSAKLHCLSLSLL